MRVQIRKGCFETNSSSMHSIAIMKNDGKDKYFSKEEIISSIGYEEDDGFYIRKLDDSYGWGYDILSTPEDKLGYALADFCGHARYKDGEEIFNEVFVPILREITGFDNIYYESSEESIYVYTPDGEADEIDELDEVYRSDLRFDSTVGDFVSRSGRPIFNIQFTAYKFGSIDHQSVGTLKDFLADTGISLEEFITRKDIIVIIDNDNGFNYEYDYALQKNALSIFTLE